MGDTNWDERSAAFLPKASKRFLARSGEGFRSSTTRKYGIIFSVYFT
jgi:hypothetical protein